MNGESHGIGDPAEAVHVAKQRHGTGMIPVGSHLQVLLCLSRTEICVISPAHLPPLPSGGLA